MNRPAMNRRGFSLLELLVVMGLLTILAALSIPAFNAAIKGSALTTASRSVVDELSFARQTALSRNTSVEVRFYQLPAALDAPTSSPKVYRALQTFLSVDNVMAPLAPAVYLPAPILFVSGDAAKSSLLDPAREKPSDTITLGPYRQNYRYTAFRFKPNGETDLPDTSMFVTLISQRDPITAAGLPANFFTIQIDPIAGTIRTFRP